MHTIMDIKLQRQRIVRKMSNAFKGISINARDDKVESIFFNTFVFYKDFYCEMTAEAKREELAFVQQICGQVHSNLAMQLNSLYDLVAEDRAFMASEEWHRFGRENHKAFKERHEATKQAIEDYKNKTPMLYGLPREDFTFVTRLYDEDSKTYTGFAEPIPCEATKVYDAWILR